jgi:FAD/FMN-containing dehydrogenase
LWKARKALYPTLYRFDPKKKPINFVDDVVVPAERISELIRYLEEFFAGQHVPVAIFGHIGNGNAHIIPLLDVSDQGDFQKMVQGYHEIHQTVLGRFGGSWGWPGARRIRENDVRPGAVRPVCEGEAELRSIRGAQPRHQDQRPALHGPYRLCAIVEILRDLRQVQRRLPGLRCVSIRRYEFARLV